MKKLLLLSAALSLTLTTVFGQSKTEQTLPEDKPEKLWFGNIYVGYNFRVAKAHPSVGNPMKARSGFKLGGDIQHVLAKNHNIALGVTVEWTLSSLTSIIGYNDETLNTQSTIHTVYAAPVLTFLQPIIKGGTLYEDISFGYLKYIESAHTINGSDLTAPLKAKCDTFGYRLSIGYRYKCWDLKYSLFNSMVTYAVFSIDGERIGSMKFANKISLASMSLTVGYHF